MDNGEIKIGIIVPAIIDQECADALVFHMKENILKPNPDCCVNFIVNIDNYRRKGCQGTSESIREAYRSLEDYENCSVSIVVSDPPLGLTLASRELFKRFVETDNDYLIFMDDDCIVVNPVPFREFIRYADSGITLHLAFAYDQASSENPFITDIKHFEGDSVVGYKNNYVFMTENGTIFTRNKISDILMEYEEFPKRFNPKLNPEDVIIHLESYKKDPVITVVFKGDKKEISIKKPNKNKKIRTIRQGAPRFRLPKECHFIVDKIRHYRQVGWNK